MPPGAVSTSTQVTAPLITPMKATPVQITFRHMYPSPAAEARIREEVAGLDLCFDRITSCQVTVDAPHQHHALGGRCYHVDIEIHAPGSVLAVNHHPSQHGTLVQGKAGGWEKSLESQPEHKDIYVSIRDAFEIARRRLRDYASILRGDVKHHAEAAAVG